MTNKYLKTVDSRESLKGRILSILREKDGKYSYLNFKGEWVEAPRLKKFFDAKNPKAYGMVTASEKEAEVFANLLKNPVMKTVTLSKEKSQKEEPEEEPAEEFDES